MEPNQDRRRGHFHRGRRGPDRRGLDRRAPSPPQPPQARDQVDVEQIMREIRARIAQRQGVELSHQQIDELAARRLEYILDPRAMKPEFVETLRRTADDGLEAEEKRLPTEPIYVFEDTTLYDSHRAILRFIRKLLNPLLKLFFNPNPLIRALHLQARLNVDIAERNAARERRQAEWNALHYKIVQRLVTEISRLSLEVQALSTRLESLGARVDFADRRVRGIEGSLHQARPAARAPEPPAPRPVEAAAPPETPETVPAPTDSARRRRRRRRGRRGAVGPADGAPGVSPQGGGESHEPFIDTAAEPFDAAAETADAAAATEPEASYAQPTSAPEPVAYEEPPAAAEPSPPPAPNAEASAPERLPDQTDRDRPE